MTEGKKMMQGYCCGRFLSLQFSDFHFASVHCRCVSSQKNLPILKRNSLYDIQSASVNLCWTRTGSKGNFGDGTSWARRCTDNGPLIANTNISVNQAPQILSFAALLLTALPELEQYVQCKGARFS